MSAASPLLDLSLRAVPSCVRPAREAAAEAARELDMPSEVVNDIRLCVSEAVANAVQHAYVGNAGNVRITLARAGRGVLVVVRDYGSGASSARPTGSRDAGGFGRRIIRTLADRCTVKSSPAEGTEVSMSFGTFSPALARR